MRRYQPALLGGLFIGVLSSLPVVNAANLCCCLWVVAGGLLTTYLEQQDRPDAVPASEAALGGLLAGVVGAVLASIVAVALFSVSGAAIQEQIRNQLEQNPQIPAQVRDRLMMLFAGHNFPLVQAGVTLPVYAVFGMLGGLLGIAIFRKKPAAAGGDSPEPPG
jgi:hypothetical protein